MITPVLSENKKIGNKNVKAKINFDRNAVIVAVQISFFEFFLSDS